MKDQVLNRHTNKGKLQGQIDSWKSYLNSNWKKDLDILLSSPRSENGWDVMMMIHNMVRTLLIPTITTGGNCIVRISAWQNKKTILIFEAIYLHTGKGYQLPHSSPRDEGGGGRLSSNTLPRWTGWQARVAWGRMQMVKCARPFQILLIVHLRCSKLLVTGEEKQKMPVQAQLFLGLADQVLEPILLLSKNRLVFTRWVKW